MYMIDWDPHSYGELEGLFTKGSWNANFASEVKQEEGDIILTDRQGFNAFDGTNLEGILKENNIGSLFVGGFLSNLCVEETIARKFQAMFELLSTVTQLNQIVLSTFIIQMRMILKI